MPAEVFIDTNVLVYAHDRDAGEKHDRAKQLVVGFWRSKPLPWLSVQVLQELLVTLCRKGVPVSAARDTVQDYLHWRVVENGVGLLKAGMEEMGRWQLSFWDGLILAAARSVGASTVYSEDLNAEQDYAGIGVLNPFSPERGHGGMSSEI
jgi:predicted nucleic acid-binding protein